MYLSIYLLGFLLMYLYCLVSNNDLEEIQPYSKLSDRKKVAVKIIISFLWLVVLFLMVSLTIINVLVKLDKKIKGL